MCASHRKQGLQRKAHHVPNRQQWLAWSALPPLSGEQLENPYPFYARARSEEPIFYSEEMCHLLDILGHTRL